MSTTTYKIISIVFWLFWLMVALSVVGLVWAFLYDVSYLRLFAFIWISSTVGLNAALVVFDILDD